MLYTEAARFLEKNSGSIKNIIYREYEQNKALKADPRQVVGLVTSTLKYKKVLTDLIKLSGLLKQEKLLTRPVALLMVHDLLVSKSGRLNCGKCPQKDAILRHKTRLKAELVKYKIKHKVSSLESLAVHDQTPVRWIRINQLKTPNDKDVLDQLDLQFVDDVKDIGPGKIFPDVNVDHLYGIDPSFAITSTDAYKKGQIIIQDRASCFPASILAPKPGEKLIDCCSAPGNKTSHLAALVNGTPNSIVAFERDTRRAETLKKMMAVSGAHKAVEIKVQDFTTANPQDYPEVTGLLVDPSCSGSGIFGRAYEENDTESAVDDARLHSLAGFQFKVVKHALSFPSARRVVYSTCSIHDEENEKVVRRLLEDEKVKAQGWKLRERHETLPRWTRRGKPSVFDGDEKLAQSCVRTIPIEDGGIGFFAVCFERSNGRAEKITNDHKEEGEEEEFEEWNGFT
uniref:ARAD1B21296p n=1 Tax=Blastobotrys adeninivorans TaxID=409370 RepID=A0A060T6R3_BLAAD